MSVRTCDGGEGGKLFKGEVHGATASYSPSGLDIRNMVRGGLAWKLSYAGVDDSASLSNWGSRYT